MTSQEEAEREAAEDLAAVPAPEPQPMMLYTHGHTCSRQDETVTVYPYTLDGVYYPAVPVCVELDVQLNFVRKEIQ